ncbi:hypothetical protein P872_18980 [Rhodonellum psychrophilum GCM71 = DSM 17998]|uniref:Outer membrane protein beta-barrel domain-containing protein n=2 Tax=Rhodonellum TaxID=336827 RepID=U5BXH2_9BACT|nr:MULTISPECIES: hypothetical protein [Rhodonellum]ERM82269.1 hypothetical protein P872_18980 [Rhodonellum psychrophilum GCM71 = DSM 17998]MDO9552974.1 hypothetical protein [Rhodonellum sp.]SDZ25578.1 hypothetical protein SAMN05444412_108144 [Rhodonellum ikkaensis]
MYKILALTFLLFGFSEALHAQQSRDHVSLGVGPSMVYGENTGDFSSFKFKMLPAMAFSYNKQLSHRFDLKSTIGAQWMNSGGYENISDQTVIEWGNNGQAFDFKGIGFFADVMPVYNFNPEVRNRVPDVVSFYAGLGVGVMHVVREQKVTNFTPMSGNVIEISDKSTTAAYIPFRFGVSSNLDFDWDYALEFTAITMTNSEIDGNNMKNKLVNPDILMQVQIIVKRYIGW